MQQWIRAWSELWNLPELPDRLRIEPSRRLRRSLGRCNPRTGLIRLHSGLFEESDELLREVLCHEVAHVAAYVLHGESVRPHGPEWGRLMIAAGYDPRARMKPSLLPERFRRAVQPRVLYQHRCPVCGAQRLARRPVHRWRCRRCREAGLEGRLEVSTIPFTDSTVA